MTNPLEDGFRLTAIGTAMTYGYSFSSGSLTSLMNAISDGVSQMTARGAPSTAEIDRARDSLVRVVATMVEVAQGQAATELQEWSFETARRKLCPLPPWIRQPC